ncbi:MAG: hypothetical protein QOH08_555 [Chloroflexota bacterium]|jgi:hypothetical protein|nr:hypothetical protein [Chloroflexota bacterium]
MLLGTDPSALKLAPTASLPHVWAVVMELRVGPDVASLVAVADGSVSLYTSRGGGVIGAGRHAGVRQAATRLLEIAERSIASFGERASFPPPSPDRVGFIVLTYERRLGADVSESEIKAGTHALAPCYDAAQDVITAMRLVSPGPA